jgi:hypothetical protein
MWSTVVKITVKYATYPHFIKKKNINKILTLMKKEFNRIEFIFFNLLIIFYVKK